MTNGSRPVRSVPSAVILGTSSVPVGGIAILGCIGGPDRFLLVPLDPTLPQQLLRRAAMTEVGRRVRAWNGRVPWFGSYRGFLLNYEGRTVEFDSDGRMLSIVKGPVYPGTINVKFRRIEHSTAEKNR